MVSDTELARQWAAGDRDAGQEVVSRHFDCVHRFFATKVDVDVDDLVQRTFLGVVENIDRIAGASSFRAYLLGIARFQLLRSFRDERRKPTPDGLHDSGIAGTDLRPSEVIAQSDEQRLLITALRQLSIELQTVVGLHYWEGLTVVEIGEVMECPAGTVKHKLWRAREKLRAAIGSLDAPEMLVSSTLGQVAGWLDALPRPDAGDPETP